VAYFWATRYGRSRTQRSRGRVVVTSFIEADDVASRCTKNLSGPWAIVHNLHAGMTARRVSLSFQVLFRK